MSFDKPVGIMEMHIKPIFRTLSGINGADFLQDWYHLFPSIRAVGNFSSSFAKLSHVVYQHYGSSMIVNDI